MFRLLCTDAVAICDRILFDAAIIIRDINFFLNTNKLHCLQILFFLMVMFVSAAVVWEQEHNSAKNNLNLKT